LSSATTSFELDAEAGTATKDLSWLDLSYNANGRIGVGLFGPVRLEMGRFMEFCSSDC
jgi:hypothetical protein